MNDENNGKLGPPLLRKRDQSLTLHLRLRVSADARAKMNHPNVSLNVPHLSWLCGRHHEDKNCKFYRTKIFMLKIAMLCDKKVI